MTMKHRPAFAAAAAAVMLAGCASSPPAYQPAPFTPATIDTSDKVAAVDTFVVVFDASSSLAENRSEKFFNAKDTVSHLNQTVPALGYNAGLVVFGPECMLGEKLARVAYGPETYSEAAFADGLNSIKCAGGPTPMARGIDLSKAEVGEAGRVALFLVSDFTKIDAGAVNKAAESFKGDLGDRLCIYPIQVGNDPKGATLAQTLASLGGCGRAVNASEIASSSAMAGYVTTALLADAPPPPVAAVNPDTDGDGVLNDADDCPNTPPGVKVNRRGCWVLAGENVLFNFNSAKFVGDDTYLMDEAARILLANPDIDVEIMGHTDNVGNPEYNRRLSERRAQAVHDYFLSKGIADERMDVRGFGSDVPLVPNDTAENRALNRRVELRAVR